MPQLSGTLAVSGLTAPVRVVRDTWGVPHIYAQNDADLFFAQGFVQAQDRLFQMDLWKRSAQGRLSEVLGPNFIERDAMTRRIQYRGDRAAEWASYGPGTQAIATAFVRGVNAWVTAARDRPPEEFVLAGWKPELWSPDDLLDRSEAFATSGDALDEVFRARLIAAVGLERARLLLPGDRGLSLPAGLDVAVIPDLVGEMIRRVGTPPFFLGLAAPVTSGTVRLKPDTPDTRSAVDIAPGRVRDGASGRVRLQSDLDRVPTLHQPSLRYLVHLNAPGWNVIGATAPWRPGVAIGHNDRLGWTAAPYLADSQDIFVEKLNPANPRQVDEAGRWVDIDVHTGRIAVRGRKTPVDFTTETTRHGVIVASDLERHLAFALRWAGSEPGAAAELAAPALDRSTSPSEFQSALARWKMPARRIAWVDHEGPPGSTVAALVPVRHEWNGALPAPGWTGSSEWAGWTSSPDARADGSARESKTRAAQIVLETTRLHPDRADALLQRLSALSSSRDSLTAQRAVLVDLLAEALRERALSSGGSVLFAHPLAVTLAARSRFNLVAPTPAAGAADPFAIVFDPHDWDRSTAIDAPGQSGSPESSHYSDLAALWSEGKTFTLAFSEAAVQAHADLTLMLTPK